MTSNPSVIAPEGELDIATLDDFRRALSEAASRPAGTLVVDLSDVSFIDSSGLGAMIETHHRLLRERRQLAVVAPRGTAAAVALGLTGLRSRLPIFETRDAAVDASKPGTSR
jgi:anti-sigma B factor antagonist